MTVAQNVGLVPKLLGWSKAKTAPRVDELLDLVGLDPGSFRSRYPKQLSGGQQQRVGVARALAADPPVMVMDEPFGAIDPITRERLQDEFLNLQKRIRKTIGQRTKHAHPSSISGRCGTLAWICAIMRG